MTQALATLRPGPGSLTAPARMTTVSGAWKLRARGAEFSEALKSFLASLRSDGTRQIYNAAISEFFDWYEIEYGQVPLPSDVTRERAFRFASFLGTHSAAFDEKRFEKQGRKLEHAIFRFLRAHPESHIANVREELLRYAELTVLSYLPNEAAPARRPERMLAIEEKDPYGLDRQLACMVQRRFLVRSPSIADIRTGRAQVGLSNPSQAQIGDRVDPNLFRYSVNQPSSPARAASVLGKLRALSSLWHWMIHHSGENQRSAEPLLKYNVWTMPARAMGAPMRAQQKIGRVEKTPSLEVFNRLLGTTYDLANDGSLVSSPTLTNVRDRALLLFMLYVVPRVSEVCAIKRSDLVSGGDKVYVTVHGKGNKDRLVNVPQAAYAALGELTETLERLALVAERRPKAEIPRARRMLSPDAPLFPPVKRWGCTVSREPDTLTRKSINMMLHERARRAGIDPGDVDFLRAHPHGLRHLGAREAIAQGAPLPVVQAVLGHENIATTGLYVETLDPRENILFDREGHRPREAPQAAPAPQRPVAAPAPRVETKPQRPSERPRAKVLVRRQEVVEVEGSSIEEPETRAPVSTPPPAPPALPESAPVAPEDQLIAIGDLAPIDETLTSGARADAVSMLASMYESHWGEKSDRTRFGVGDMAQVYRGTKSGLLWWAGPGGKLWPEMPVLGPSQVMGYPTAFGTVRDDLDALYHEWMDTPERGPTASAALLAWVRDALSVGDAAIREGEKRGATWLLHEAPLEWTASPSAMRLHRDDRVAGWFRERAFEHRMSVGRAGVKGRESRVIDTRPVLPSWYASTDPILELPESERRDLVDWLLALTGRPPVDASARYMGASRRDVAQVIGLMCEYDERGDDLREVKDQSERATIRSDLKALAEGLALVVSKATRGRVPKWDYAARAGVRRQETRTRESVKEDESEEAQPSKRRGFYLRMIGELFGTEASRDEALSIFALCSRGAPLAEGEYPALFRFEKGTIRHTEEFQKKFAKLTGAHSECVARRLARELWELRRDRDKSPGAKRLLERSDELIATLDAMAAYRVPCPGALERELKTRLGTQKAQPIYEEWMRQVRSKEEEPSEDDVDIAEILSDAQERQKDAVRRDFARAQEHEYKQNARKFVPSPMRLLFALHAR